MAEAPRVAQEAAVRRAPRIPAFHRPALIALVAAVLAVGTLASAPAPASAAALKVVIVVGPAGSSTAKYLTSARAYAAQARSYGAAVTEVYTPNATWARVRSAAQGANLLIYLGHGNGWPSPHAPFDAKRKDGLGLNPYAGSGNTKTTYYGEWWIRTYIKLAPNAVVILNRLCYASGNSEPGYADPTLSRRPPAGGQLRRRVPRGGREGGLRQRHRQRVLRPVRPVQDQPDRRADLLVGPDGHEDPDQPVLVVAAAGFGRHPRPVSRGALLPLRDRVACSMTASTWR